MMAFIMLFTNFTNQIILNDPDDCVIMFLYQE